MPNLYDFFERACQRPVSTLQGSPGTKILDDEGNSVQFFLEVAAGRVTAAHYRCTSCFILIGLCEHLSHLATGLPLPQVAALGPGTLLKLHPEVPSYRAGRATLAVNALHSALEHITEGACV